VPLSVSPSNGGKVEFVPVPRKKRVHCKQSDFGMRCLHRGACARPTALLTRHLTGHFWVCRLRGGPGGDRHAGGQRAEPDAVGEGDGARRRVGLHQNPHRRRHPPALGAPPALVPVLGLQTDENTALKQIYPPQHTLSYLTVYLILLTEKARHTKVTYFIRVGFF